MCFYFSFSQKSTAIKRNINNKFTQRVRVNTMTHTDSRLYLFKHNNEMYYVG